ncbi:extracellular solute-binding protein [Paludisphaera sp.]|uniref:ABC transporter substrate-binding protein n=1 Tax=Paludisphaera sp. TaxID=2017432 RepID=UPI00301DA55E
MRLSVVATRDRGGAARRAFALAGLMAAFVGCSEPAPEGPKPPPTFPGVRLSVGAVGDPAILVGVAAQRGEWAASRKGEVDVLADAPRSPDTAGDLDVLVFPGQMLGDLIDRDLLDEIPNDVVLPPRAEDAPGGREARPKAVDPDDPGAGFRYEDIAPAFRDHVSKYGSERYALPIGGSALVLAYRRDAFASESNVAAARELGVELAPPATWEQLDAIAGFLHGRDWDGDGSPDHGLAAALGDDAEGVADATFLARAASLGQHRDHFSFLFDAGDLTPRLESPPFVEALRAVAAWKAFGPPGAEGFDIAAARAAFRDGKVAMLIDRAEKAAEWNSPRDVSVAPLPGSGRVYEPLRATWDEGSVNRPTYLPFGGGWLVGVRKGLDEAKRDAARDFALYLADAEVANRLLAERPFPMLSARSSQMGRGLPDPSAAPNVDSRGWSSAVSRSLMAERVLPGLRVPDAAGYLADLSVGRVAAVAGETPEEALKRVAEAWRERSEALGVERQLWHYRRSLNTLATSPEPPPASGRARP